MAIIALDFGGTRIKIGLFEAGIPLHCSDLSASGAESFAALLPSLEHRIEQLLQAYACTRIEGIGMAFPTIVDSDRMRLLYRYVKYSDAGDIDLRAWARATWGAALVLENDARAALVGEWQSGAGRGVQNLLMLTLGTGVGSAALVNGRLLKGAHYLAGNLGGHQNIRYDGILCNCGNRGCLESEAASWSLPALLQQHARFPGSAFAKGEKQDYEAVFRLAAAGDALASEVRDRSLEAWSAGLLNLVYAYDPECVVLGGGVMHSAAVILPFMQEKIDRAAWLPPQAVRLVAAQEPDWAGVKGMAYLAGEYLNHLS